MTNDSRIMDIVYKRKNGENITYDPQAIESCKNEQSRDVIDNARLGSYDKFGNYIIIPDIKRELVSMPKLVYNVKTDANRTVYELKGSIPLFGDLYFKLVFAGEEAVLQITETVNREANGYLEVYDEVVDSMSYGKNALPQDIIFRNYNVVDKPDDFGKTSGLYDFNNILTRKVYLSLLSKELKEVSKFDEHDAFNKMVNTLKESGEYGTRVLKEFVNRLKERPGIFEITQTENYNKAVNEVLLSSLDLATTQEDKEEYSTRQTYFKVLNARNENIQEFLNEANARVDEKYVKHIVDKATESFQEENAEEDESVEEFFDRIANKKSVPTKRKLEKAILKQGKGQEEEEAKSKEDKIKSILDKKEKDKKKTPAGKKLKPSKGKSSSKKLKGDKKKSASKKKAGAKKKGAKKKLGKGKLKGKKKKVNKAKSPQKAKAKAGKLGGKAGGGAKKAKAKAAGGPRNNNTMKLALAAATPVEAADVVPVVMAVSSQENETPLYTLKAKQAKKEDKSQEKEEYAAPVAKGSFVFKRAEDSKVQGFSNNRDFRNEFKTKDFKDKYDNFIANNGNEAVVLDKFFNRYNESQTAINNELKNNANENPFKADVLRGFRKAEENNMSKDQPIQEEVAPIPPIQEAQPQTSVEQNPVAEAQPVQQDQPTPQVSQPVTQPEQNPVPETPPTAQPVAPVQDDIS